MVVAHRCVRAGLLCDLSHLVSLLSSAAFCVNAGVAQGWAPRWDDTGTVLSCVPELKSTQHRSIIIAVVVASAAVLIVAFLVWRQYLRTRPRWLRERMLQVGMSYNVATAAERLSKQANKQHPTLATAAHASSTISPPAHLHNMREHKRIIHCATQLNMMQDGWITGLAC